MDRVRRAQVSGTIGVIGGVLWMTSWIGEAFFESGEGSGGWYADQFLATAALFGTAVLMYGFASTLSGAWAGQPVSPSP